ncbi:terminase small subunit [Geomicrobium sp. JCM 19055]|uniref:terminase small subunit n=1 Tax=Geomicrobium sp. JCM 19055 TaxID=1460649 RepID=UPI00045EDB55|nr:terminase small subunit [Geomicrobium sp. JCM 19055]GAK01494.1 phage terminase small subunit [Geomicrobium sp. JCM 19055]
MKMTVKQRRFADEYIICGNAEEAAKTAGYSARGNTTKLLQNTTIRNYIDERLAEIESDKVAKQEEIMQYLTRVKRREEKEYTVITVKKRKEYWKPDSNGTIRKFVEEIEEPMTVGYPAKLADANKAAELLGKRYAMWTDKQEVSVEGAVQFVDDIGDEDGG